MLEDLKENVVIGRTIPVGTGLIQNQKLNFWALIVNRGIPYWISTMDFISYFLSLFF